MLSASGSSLVCKVLDFGLAKGTSSQDLLRRSDDKPLTRSGGFVGTPGYISPEVIDGASEDPRQDVYALGVVWWELVSGRHPFPAETPMKTLVRQLHEDPPPLDAALAAKDGIPDDGLALIAAMMARGALRRAAAAPSTSTKTPSPSPPPALRSKTPSPAPPHAPAPAPPPRPVPHRRRHQRPLPAVRPSLSWAGVATSQRGAPTTALARPRRRRRRRPRRRQRRQRRPPAPMSAWPDDDGDACASAS